MTKTRLVKTWVPENFRRKAKAKAADRGISMGAFLDDLAGSDDDWKMAFCDDKKKIKKLRLI